MTAEERLEARHSGTYAVSVVAACTVLGLWAKLV